MTRPPSRRLRLRRPRKLPLAACRAPGRSRDHPTEGDREIPMPIARRLRWYLDQCGVPYEVLPHPHSECSAETARQARIPADRLAKPVLLEDERGYVVAVVPASRRIDLRSLGAQLHRELELASEEEIATLFPDCERGALPPIAPAYRLPVVFDDALSKLPEVYFEAGDHEDVVHVRGEDFVALLEGALHGHFSRTL